MDAQAEAAAAHRHDVPRRAPVAAGHARAHLRHAGHRRLRGAPRCRIFSAWKCGAARRSTSRCGSCTKIPWQRLRAAARGDSEHLFPDAAARRRTPSATRTIPTTWSREFVDEAAAQGIDIFRIFDSLNWLPNMKACDGGGARRRDAICEAAICYTGDILDPERDEVLAEVLRRAWRRSWRRMGAHILHQGHGRPVQAVRRGEAGEGAARGDRHPDPFPHARHQRHQRGVAF